MFHSNVTWNLWTWKLIKVPKEPIIKSGEGKGDGIVVDKGT